MQPLPHRRVRQIDHLKAGQAVRRERDSSGISLRSLAAEMGVGVATMSDLETGRRHWTPDRWREAWAAIEAVRQRQQAEMHKRGTLKF